MSRVDIAAIVPMKPLHLTKTRLSNRLTPSQRMALSLEMFRTVVQAAVESNVGKVWVIGGDETVRQASLELGAEWCVDEGKDLNDSLNMTIAQAFDAGLAAIYLPADLAFVTPDDLNAIIDESRQGTILTLSPAHRDGGTNAVLIPLDSTFRLALGVDSFQRHQRRAESLGLKTAICDRAGLGFDLDTPDDLNDYENALSSNRPETERAGD